MNKLFGLFLLAIAFFAPHNAWAFNCFWVGSTGTWDASSITNWSPTTGAAATGCSTSNAAPTTGDIVTMDGSSGGGTITVAAGVNNLALGGLTIGSFTGTLDFATNSVSMSFSGNGGFSLTGAGTKTVNLGSGTFTLSNNAGFWSCGTCTNLTLNAGTSTIAFTGTGAGSPNARRFAGGGKTYATVSAVSSTIPFVISGANTVGTYTFSPGQTIILNGNSTQTVTTITNIAGSSSLQTVFVPADPVTSLNAIVLTNNWICDWCGFSSTVFTGAGSKTATNSFDFKGNSGITITPPSGGGGGGRIIGG